MDIQDLKEKLLDIERQLKQTHMEFTKYQGSIKPEDRQKSIEALERMSLLESQKANIEADIRALEDE